MRRLLAAISIALMALTTVITVPTTAAHATDTGAEADFVGRINGLRGANGLPGLGVHPVLTAKAQYWAQRMANSGSIYHSTLTDGISVSWRKLGENVGKGPSVSALEAAFEASAPHRANMLDGQFRWVGVGVAWSGSTMYVAEEFMDGDGPAPPPITVPANFMTADYRGRAIAARPQGGFWVLSGNGSVTAYEGAPYYGAPSFGWDAARDIVSMPDGNGYAILDGFGAVHKYGSANQWIGGLTSPYFRWDIARSLALAPDGKGFAVLDGFGGVNVTGTVHKPGGLPYWKGWDIARSLAIAPNGGMYILDGFGSVWARGGAVFRGAPYFGWDIARDLTVRPDGNGYAVIDGYGGIFEFGSAPNAKPTDYSTLNRWRGIVSAGSGYLVVRNDGFPQRV